MIAHRTVHRHLVVSIDIASFSITAIVANIVVVIVVVIITSVVVIVDVVVGIIAIIIMIIVSILSIVIMVFVIVNDIIIVVGNIIVIGMGSSSSVVRFPCVSCLRRSVPERACANYAAQAAMGLVG